MKRRGFSFIELMIVVSIISVLAAIAVPNYVEAQVRTKVVRAKSDMRAVVISLEQYRLDNNVYPPAAELGNPSAAVATGTGPIYEGMLPPNFTTPIAYIHPLPRDPFPPLADGFGESPLNSFHYLDRKSAEARGEMTLFDDYHEACFGRTNSGSSFWVLSVGPDLHHDRNLTGPELPVAIYDATNGTVSSGDLYYFQGTGLQ